ncbi:MAG: hypothetical protein M5R36_17170 [Deltaproteobacteria bacterium]|nr:hypothetical protein [Deltaproteobacteria bacterium]
MGERVRFGFGVYRHGPCGRTGACEKDPFNDPNDRIVKLHRYNRPYFYPLAIVTTNVGISLGYDYSTIEYKEKQDFGLFKEDKFQFGGLAERLGAEFMLNERFSLEFLLEGRALAGVDDESAMLYGGQLTYAASVIPKFSVYHSERSGTSIALAAGLAYDNGAQTSPLVLMLKVIENAIDELNEAVETGEMSESDLESIYDVKLKDGTFTFERTGFSPSLLLVQTLSPLIGLDGGLRYDYALNEKYDAPSSVGGDSTDKTNIISVGGGVSFDFHAVSSAPVGIRGEFDYGIEQPEEGKDPTSTKLGGMIYYSGRRNLDLSANIMRWTAEMDEDTDGSDLFLILTMRY